MKYITILLSILYLFNNRAEAQFNVGQNLWHGGYNRNDFNIVGQRCTSCVRNGFKIKGNDYKDRVGFTDSKGKIVIAPVYSNASDFYGKYALVEDSLRKVGMIDTAGRIIIPLEYKKIERCDSDLVFIYKDGKVGLMNMNGKIIIPADHYTFHATKWPHLKSNTWSDWGGEEIWLNFNESPDFKQYMGVEYQNKWGVIDKSGKERISPRFDGIDVFNNNIAPVIVNQKVGVTSIDGKLIIPAKYNDIIISGDGQYIFGYLNKKIGVLSPGNKVIVPMRHLDEIMQINNEAFWILKHGKCGVVNNQNKMIIPLGNYRIEKFGTGYRVTNDRGNLSFFDRYGQQQVSDKKIEQ